MAEHLICPRCNLDLSKILSITDDQELREKIIRIHTDAHFKNDFWVMHKALSDIKSCDNLGTVVRIMMADDLAEIFTWYKKIEKEYKNMGEECPTT